MTATAEEVVDIAEAGVAEENIVVIVTDRGQDSSLPVPGF